MHQLPVIPFSTFGDQKCGMADLWDQEEPDRISERKPLCPSLWHKPKPFKMVFENREYKVLKVPGRTVKVNVPGQNA